MSTEELATSTAVDAVAALAQRAANRAPHIIEDRDGTPRLLVQTVQVDTDREDIRVIDIDHYGNRSAPDQRVRGDYRFDDLASLLAYAQPFRTDHSTAWVITDSAKVRIWLDDHAAIEAASDGLGQAHGLREHVAQLDLKPSPEWVKWSAMHEQLVPQQEFAEFLEDNSLDVVDPTGATLLELIRDFQATSTGEFASIVNATNGDRELIFKETTVESGGAGRVALPPAITVSLRRFVGEERIDVECRLRWRKRGAGVAFGLLLTDVDGITESTLRAIQSRVTEAFPRTYLGTGA